MGFLTRLWRRKLWFASVFAVVFALAAAILLTWPYHYSAQGAVIVGESEGTSRPAEATDIESQAALIRSPRLLRMVLARPGVAEAAQQDCQRSLGWTARLFGAPGTKCGTGIDAIIVHAARQVQVAPAGASRVVAVGYTAATPETAQGMANFLIQTFLDEPRPATLADRERAVGRLRQEVSAIELAMREDETKLAAVQREFTARAAMLEKSAEPPAANTAAQQAMVDNALKMKAYQRGIGGPPDIRAGLDAQASSAVQAQYDALQTRISTEPPSSPMLRSLRAHREELRLRLERDNAPGFRAANRAYLAAATQVATTSLQLIADVRPQVPPDPGPDPASIERRLELKRQLYLDAYRRASALEAEPLPATVANRLVNLAERPATPNERLGPAWLGSLVLALGLGTIAAVWRDASDMTIRSVAAIEGNRSTSVLAQIPRVTPAGNLSGPPGIDSTRAPAQ